MRKNPGSSQGPNSIVSPRGNQEKSVDWALQEWARKKIWNRLTIPSLKTVTLFNRLISIWGSLL